MDKIHRCEKCILTDQFAGVKIDSNGSCNYCNQFKPFEPYGESELLKIFKTAQNKNRIYDALVPLSGGKDSTYVLWLAVKKYGLRVLTYTYDNGFLSEHARQNIRSAVQTCEVDHVWVKHNEEMLYKLYRTTLKLSGEICGICGVGIERSMLKISEAYHIPLILLGHAPAEQNSFTSENIYDQTRIKAILKRDKSIGKSMTDRFLLYPELNYISSFLFTKMGRFGKKINILYYIDALSDKEIGDLLKKEMGWTEPRESEYTRHFDCLAEPFTNYIREKRFGFSRRIPQLSNMIRNCEINREEAFKIVGLDQQKMQPDDFSIVMEKLQLSKTDVENIGRIPVGVFSQESSWFNKVFALMRQILKKNAH
jgi:tRNA(Ile)-lysidine synthase TilS/MesJ